MLRELFSSRLFVGGLIGCALLVAGIQFWSHHEHRKLRRDEAATRQFIQKVEADKTASPTREEEIDSTSQAQEVAFDSRETRERFVEIPDKNAPEVDNARLSLNTSEFEREDNVFPQADSEPAETRRMSLFGFGPYPEIPVDYPEQDAWDAIEELYRTEPKEARKHELMERVCIKLWNQGLHAAGVTYESDSGLIYPLYPNTAYIKWDVWEEEDGTFARYPAEILGGPGLDRYEEDFAAGEIPPGITVIDYDEGGIDPYQFLDFENE